MVKRVYQMLSTKKTTIGLGPKYSDPITLLCKTPGPHKMPRTIYHSNVNTRRWESLTKIEVAKASTDLK